MQQIYNIIYCYFVIFSVFMINVVFCGSSDFSMPSLNLIAKDAKFDLKCIYTQHPQKSGRGMKETKTIVHNFADANLINVRTPIKFSKDDELFLQSLNIDFLIVVSYGIILPNYILKTAKYCLNIHPSALPKYRGASPIETSIQNNDQHTKVCIIKMDAKMDSGDIMYESQDIDIYNKTATEISEMTSNIGAIALVELIKNLSSNLYLVKNQNISINYNNETYHGIICQKPQYHNSATFVKKIQKEDLFLPPQDINKLATRDIFCKILSLTTFGFFRTTIANKICKINTAIEVDFNLIIKNHKNKSLEYNLTEFNIENIKNKYQNNQDNLKEIFTILKINYKQLFSIIQHSLYCKDGIIIPLEITPENGKKMLFKDFVNGIR